MIKFVALLLSMAVIAGCGEKKTAAPEDTGPVIITPEELARAATPPKLFDDLARQRRFESMFNAYKHAFAAPEPGMLIKADLIGGKTVIGKMVHYTGGGMILATDDGANVTVLHNAMLPESQKELFIGSFARLMAEEHVRDGGRSRSIQPEDLFFPAKAEGTKETRRISAERTTPRLGPGRYFGVAGANNLFRGQSVQVVTERNGWIAIHPAGEGPAALGWIPKFHSFTPNPDDREIIAREVQRMREDGFLIRIEPQRNEAQVDLFTWRIADPASAEGKSRALAFYCGHQRNVRLYWVDIKDAAEGGRKLAEYSESKGFRRF